MSFKHLSDPIFALNRGPAPEFVLHGAVTSKIQNEDPTGSCQFQFLTRSLLNPWQFLSAGVRSVSPLWSMGLAFHSGQDIHMKALDGLSREARAGDAELFCPREYPVDWEYAARMRFSGIRPSRIHHPCSGKHLMILAACEKRGIEKNNYWEPGHPLQKSLFSLIGKEARKQVQWVYDSCGLPTFLMDMKTHLKMWERLALDESEISVVMKDLWLNNPRLVGGRGRLDSDLTIAAGGKALVKEGSDGLLIVQSFPDGPHPAASVLIKLSSGYHKAFLALALYTTIKKQKSLPPVFQDLMEYLGSRMDEWVPRDHTLIEGVPGV